VRKEGRSRHEVSRAFLVLLHHEKRRDSFYLVLAISGLLVKGGEKSRTRKASDV